MLGDLSIPGIPFLLSISRSEGMIQAGMGSGGVGNSRLLIEAPDRVWPSPDAFPSGPTLWGGWAQVGPKPLPDAPVSPKQEDHHSHLLSSILTLQPPSNR